MARLQFEGIDEYASQLAGFVEKSEGMIKRAVYDGAAVMMSEMKNQIAALPELKDKFFSPYEIPIKGVTASEKRGLMTGVGLAKMRNDGGLVNTKIGFEGYNGVKTKKFPSGQPNVLIARAVNSGSSFRVKIPFVSRAVKAAKEKAEAAMAARFDADTKEMLK